MAEVTQYAITEFNPINHKISLPSTPAEYDADLDNWIKFEQDSDPKNKEEIAKRFYERKGNKVWSLDSEYSFQIMASDDEFPTGVVDDLQRRIRANFEIDGTLYEDNPHKVISQVGIPDLFVSTQSTEDNFLFVEVKSGRDGVRKSQL